MEKTYIAKIKGNVEDKDLKRLQEGIKIEDYTTRPAKIKKIKYDKETNRTEIKITIHEGKNRQVRKMFETMGYDVLKLHRNNIGQIDVQNMKLGEWRYLTRRRNK